MGDLVNHIKQLEIRLNEAINKKINYQKLYLDSIKNSFALKNPMIMFENRKQNLDLLNNKLYDLIINKIEKEKVNLNHLRKSYVLQNPSLIYKNEKILLKNIIDKLNLLNPLNILSRGYSISYFNDKTLKSVKSVRKNDLIDIKLTDGFIKTKVMEIKEEK